MKNWTLPAVPGSPGDNNRGSALHTQHQQTFESGVEEGIADSRDRRFDSKGAPEGIRTCRRCSPGCSC
jgi:hypothetical protein